MASTEIVLRQAPADPPCAELTDDSNPASSVTFRIDPAATEQVSAVSNLAVVFPTYWSPGFRPGAATERVIRDPTGQVVVKDGDVLPIPKTGHPRLRGYLVLYCTGEGTLYVLLTDPP